MSNFWIPVRYVYALSVILSYLQPIMFKVWIPVRCEKASSVIVSWRQKFMYRVWIPFRCEYALSVMVPWLHHLMFKVCMLSRCENALFSKWVLYHNTLWIKPSLRDSDLCNINRQLFSGVWQQLLKLSWGKIVLESKVVKVWMLMGLESISLSTKASYKHLLIDWILAPSIYYCFLSQLRLFSNTCVWKLSTNVTLSCQELHSLKIWNIQVSQIR